jgi:hypothetical protein
MNPKTRPCHSHCNTNIYEIKRGNALKSLEETAYFIKHKMTQTKNPLESVSPRPKVELAKQICDKKT